MTFRKYLWMGTVSSLALACSIVPALAADDSAPEEIVVTGYRASLEKSLDAKRESTGVQEVVSAEDVGKLPDKNIADALQRLPGINTMNSGTGGSGGFDENDRVAVRGGSPSLTYTLLNGHEVGSGDWFVLDQYQAEGRGISFDVLPSEILSQATVHKSQQADLPDGGVNGTINLQTPKPLDTKQSFTAMLNTGFSYNDLAGSAMPQLNGEINWHNDARTFGVNFIGFYEERDLRRDGQEVLGYDQIQPNTTLGKAGYTGYYAPGLMTDAFFTQTREREGGVLDVEYQPSDKWTFDVNGFYSHMNANNVNDDAFLWPGNGGGPVTGNGPMPTNIQTNGNIITSMIEPGGKNNVWGIDQIPRTAYAGSQYIDANAKYQPNSDWVVTVDGGVAHGVGKTSSSNANEYVNTNAGGYQLNGMSPFKFLFPNGNGFFTNPTAGAGWAYSWNWSDMLTVEDDDYYGQTDVEYFTDWGPLTSIKAGVRYNAHDRTTPVAVDGGPNWGAYDPANELPNGTKGPVWHGTTTPSNFGKGLGQGATFPFFTLSQASQNAWAATYTNSLYPGRYDWQLVNDVHEKTYAGYVMGNFETDLGGTKLTGNAGVRVVHTDEHIPYNLAPGPNPITTSAFGPYTPTNADYGYTDVLPSLNFSDNFRPDMYIKGSVAKAIARPDYTALGGSVSLTDSIYSGTANNPYLKPVRSTNYDLDWEWYFAPRSMMSAALFYDDYQEFYDYTTASQVYYNQYYKQFTPYNVTTYINVPGAAKGYELNYQQELFKGFGVSGNYTNTLGKLSNGDPMPGQTRQLYTVGGYYEDDLVSLHVNYSFHDHFFVTIDRSTPYYQDQFATLDGALNIKLTPELTWNIDALNMLDAKLKYYAYGPSSPRGTYDNGRTIYSTLSYKY